MDLKDFIKKKDKTVIRESFRVDRFDDDELDLIREARKSKKADPFVNINGKAVRVDLEDHVGAKVKKNNRQRGAWAVDEPEDNDVYDFVDKTQLDRNMRQLIQKFKAKEPFFIQGAAGWGKTEIIKKTAKKFKRSVITVYLDKAEATDLGGIPIPNKGDTGVVKQDMAMPGWAAYMLEHEDEDFLLFFDEMNQAMPDVMNALMPIVKDNTICGVEFDNFFVGAAGNFDYENEGGLSELSEPLKQRFAPIIVWESRTEATWKSAFNHMRKKWEGKTDPELMDLLEENADMFASPRIIDHKILQYISEMSKWTDNADNMDAEDVLIRLKSLVTDDALKSRSSIEVLEALANKIYDTICSLSDGAAASSKSRKNRKNKTLNVDQEQLNLYIQFAKDGVLEDVYVNSKGRNQRYKLFVTKENFVEIASMDFDNAQEAEMVRDFIQEWRFETNADALKAKNDPDSQVKIKKAVLEIKKDGDE